MKYRAALRQRLAELKARQKEDYALAKHGDALQKGAPDSFIGNVGKLALYAFNLTNDHRSDLEKLLNALEKAEKNFENIESNYDCTCTPADKYRNVGDHKCQACWAQEALAELRILLDRPEKGTP